MHPERPASLAGLVVVRGAGAAVVPRRLPRGTTVHVGRRERHGVELRPEWVPLDLVSLAPVEEGWLATNTTRARMRVECDWVLGGAATFLPGATVMLQRGEHRLLWPELAHPVGVSVSVRTRRLEDQRVAYVVDSTVNADGRGVGSYLGVDDAPMSDSLRYRLAVLFRHLLEGEPEPLRLVARRAEFLGLSEDALDETAQRFRRRVNAVSGTDLQSLDELGAYLVGPAGVLTRADLDP